MPPEHYGEKWEEIDLNNLPHGWFFNVGLNAIAPEDMPDKRLLDHPANIRQMRLTVVSRSSRARSADSRATTCCCGPTTLLTRMERRCPMAPSPGATWRT